MRSFLILTLLFVISGCAAGQILPESERSFQYVEDTGVKKAAAYTAIMTNLTKTLGDSDKAIKLSDKDAGKIVAHTNVTCNKLRQAGDINNYSLKFVLDITVKDEKAKFSFENLEMVGESGAPTGWAYNSISSAEKLEKVEPCALAVRDEFLAAIKKSDF